MEHTWVLLALLSAFSLATSDALAKRTLSASNEYLVALFRLLFSLPLLLVTLISIPVPSLDREFYMAYGLALPIELITVVLYIKALKESPLSLSLPFLALTPVFLIFFSYFILGERVSSQGAAGIVMIAAGGYLLTAAGPGKGILEPFRAIGRERGILYMTGVALLYALTSSLGKRAIEHSSPLFFGAVYFVGLSILFLPIGLLRGRSDLRQFLATGRYKEQLLPGIFYGVMVLSHMAAMKLTKVAYMVSVKRSSLLMGILYGYFMFREDNIRGRFLGGLLMLSGFVMVVTAQ
ncbi:MAG: EamA/RhaT family transporter [Nitrospirae bacterium]|nr:MAG: EamA/RhaT family transporter [Nitrospirota bacterium]